MLDPLTWLQPALQELAVEGLLRQRRTVTPLPDGWCEVAERRLRNFAGNDYLNLAHDPRVIAAAQAALGQAGSGVTASALVCGRTEWHAELELQLARFLGTPAALLYPTGYAANVGAIAALAGPEDLIYCDRLNHASLVDGCRLSGARLRVYRHARLDRLAAELAKAPVSGRRWLVTESLFSMDGDAAPMAELADLAERHSAVLVVDEAHALGVLGHQGQGLAEALQIAARVPVRIGTLSKAFGALGGFVAGSTELIDWLWNRSRTQMFSTALPASVCAAALQSLQIVRDEPARRQAVLDRSAELRGLLASHQIETTAGTGPIVPALLHTAERAVTVAQRLEQAGFLVAAIRPPTVPRGTSRLRITLSAAHLSEDIVRLVDALKSALS